MQKWELQKWLEEKGWHKYGEDSYVKDKRRFRIDGDRVYFQKHSVVNGYRTLYFAKIENLSITAEGKLTGWLVGIKRSNQCAVSP